MSPAAPKTAPCHVPSPGFDGGLSNFEMLGMRERCGREDHQPLQGKDISRAPAMLSPPQSCSGPWAVARSRRWGVRRGNSKASSRLLLLLLYMAMFPHPPLGAPGAAPACPSLLSRSAGTPEVLQPPRWSAEPEGPSESPVWRVIPTPRLWWPSWPGCVVALCRHALWAGSAATGRAQIPKVACKAPMLSH